MRWIWIALATIVKDGCSKLLTHEVPDLHTLLMIIVLQYQSHLTIHDHDEAFGETVQLVASPLRVRWKGRLS